VSSAVRGAALRVERVRTSGIFSLDGGDYEVENNVWLVGNDDEVVVIDAAHRAEPIVAAVAGRTVSLIIATHGHNDHINAAAELAEAVEALIALHPADRPLWDVVYPDRAPDRDLADGQEIVVAGHALQILHTPGHSPGGVSVSFPSGEALFSGDTLFQGGPGATGRSFSDFPTIIESIRTKLLSLPGSTVVHTGHGEDTTIGGEAPHLEEWIARGH
jgi:glyoxylase-like metal-dependent hydrolase (beta-lactamase superfamily II)